MKKFIPAVLALSSFAMIVVPAFAAKAPLVSSKTQTAKSFKTIKVSKRPLVKNNVVVGMKKAK